MKQVEVGSKEVDYVSRQKAGTTHEKDMLTNDRQQQKMELVAQNRELQWKVLLRFSGMVQNGYFQYSKSCESLMNILIVGNIRDKLGANRACARKSG